MLSDLVGFLRWIESFDINTARTAMATELGSVMPNVESSVLLPPDIKASMRNDYRVIQNAITQFDETVLRIKQHLASQIAEMEPSYLNTSLQLYNSGVRIHESSQQILDRQLNLDPGITEIISTRIGIRSNWQYPGMIIRPAKESWIDILVGLDPMYIVDETDLLLEPVRQKFNEQYLSRIRMILIDRLRDENILEPLPDNQFSYCLAYNFFNYKPMEVIQQYLGELYVKLRPGGIVAITINDCDQAGGVKLAENNVCCYTPGRMVKSFAQSLGFNLLFEQAVNSAVTWLEFEKPGTLSTIKGGQALARIIVKS